MRARSIHGDKFSGGLRLMIKWNSAMISRAPTKVGMPASITAKVTVSAFESV